MLNGKQNRARSGALLRYSLGKASFALLLVFFGTALVGCPPPAPQSINILEPKDLEAHDVDLVSNSTSIEISIDLTSSSGRPLQEGSFQAILRMDLPGVGPDDLDERGDPIEQPYDLTPHFTVNYQEEMASLTTPIELSIGWYYLEVKVLDDQNVEATDLVFFSIDYPGPLFLGSTSSPSDFMYASLAGVYDECFNGALDSIWEEGVLSVGNLPTFLEVEAAPFGLLVNLGVPTTIAPSGTISIRASIVNNAILFPPKQIGPIDLSPSSGGIVPCQISFRLSGVFQRTGAETASPRLACQNVTIGNSPSGGTCWLAPPPAGCEIVIDLDAVAAYP